MIHHIRIAHGLAVAGKFILFALVVKVALLLLLIPLWRAIFVRRPARGRLTGPVLRLR